MQNVLVIPDRKMTGAALKRELEEFLSSNDTQATTYELADLYARSVAAYAASNIRAENVAQVTLQVSTDQDTPLPDHPANKILGGPADQYDLLQWSELSLCFFGHNVIQKQYNHLNELIGLRWLNPRGYTLEVHEIYGLLGVNLLGEANRAYDFIPGSELIFMREFDFFNDFGGVGPAEAAFDKASVGIETAQTTLSFLQNRAVPLGFVQPAEIKSMSELPSPGLLGKMRRLLREQAQGAKNAGRTIVTSRRWEWLQLQQKFDDAGLTAIEDSAEADVAMAFRVPLSLLKSDADSYATAYQADRGWVDKWLKPRVRWMSAQFARGLGLEAEGLLLVPDLSLITTADVKAQTETANAQLRGGYLTLYEAQVATGHKNPDPNLRKLYMIRGQVLRSEDVPKIAANNAAVQLAPPAPAEEDGGALMDEPTPAPAAPATIEAQPEKLPPRPPAPIQSDEKLLIDVDHWLPGEVFRELSNLIKVQARKGGVANFDPQHLRDDEVSFVQWLAAMRSTPDYMLAQGKAYILARQQTELACKAYAEVERQYRNTLNGILRDTFAGRMDKTDFRRVGRQVIRRQFDQAFRQGLIDGGVDADNLAEAEAAFLKEQISAERTHWTGLSNNIWTNVLPLHQQAEELLRLAALSPDRHERDRLRSEALQLDAKFWKQRDATINRLDLWAQGLNRIYQQGLLSGKTNQMLRWTRDPVKDNCRSCVKLDGQIHRASYWNKQNLFPGSDRLICVGGAGGVPVCGCGFEVTSEKARGRLRGVPLVGAKANPEAGDHTFPILAELPIDNPQAAAGSVFTGYLYQPLTTNAARRAAAEGLTASLIGGGAAMGWRLFADQLQAQHDSAMIAVWVDGLHVQPAAVLLELNKDCQADHKHQLRQARSDHGPDSSQAQDLLDHLSDHGLAHDVTRAALAEGYKAVQYGLGVLVLDPQVLDQVHIYTGLFDD